MTCVRKTLYGDGSESWESTDLCQHKNHIRLLSFTSCCRLVFYFYHKGFNLKKHAILNWKMQMLQQDFSLICGVVGLLYAQRDVILNSLYLTKSQLLYSKISNLGSPGEEMFFWRKQSNISSVIWRFLYLSDGFADLLKTRVGLAEGPEISAINCVLWLQRGLALASWQPTICSSSSSSLSPLS